MLESWTTSTISYLMISSAAIGVELSGFFYFIFILGEAAAFLVTSFMHPVIVQIPLIVLSVIVQICTPSQYQLKHIGPKAL